MLGAGGPLIKQANFFLVKNIYLLLLIRNFFCDWPAANKKFFSNQYLFSKGPGAQGPYYCREILFQVNYMGRRAHKLTRILFLLGPYSMGLRPISKGPVGLLSYRACGP